MSVGVTSWAFKQQMPPVEKLVLICLSDWAAEYGFLMPEPEQLCNKACMPADEIKSIIDGFIENGLIVKTRRVINNKPVYKMVMS